MNILPKAFTDVRRLQGKNAYENTEACRDVCTGTSLGLPQHWKTHLAALRPAPLSICRHPSECYQLVAARSEVLGACCTVLCRTTLYSTHVHPSGKADMKLQHRCHAIRRACNVATPLDTHRPCRGRKSLQSQTSAFIASVANTWQHHCAIHVGLTLDLPCR